MEEGYDPMRDTWTCKAGILMPNANLCSFAFYGKLYVGSTFTQIPITIAEISYKYKLGSDH